MAGLYFRQNGALVAGALGSLPPEYLSAATRFRRVDVSGVSGISTTGVRIADTTLPRPWPGQAVLVTVVANVVATLTVQNGKPGLIAQITDAAEATTYARAEDQYQSPNSVETRQITTRAVIPASASSDIRVAATFVNRNASGTVGVNGSPATDYLTVTIEPALEV